ncbi:MAG: alpha/beta fold hydrolase [Myxococcales bacterium]|nr:alpha/beta fold hydrolase [Myxococcales bacterium]
MTALVVALLFASAPEPTVSHRRVVASDGASLALYRYLPPGKGEGRSPVLLVGEIGFGRPLFDLHREGLARWLAARGYAVYVAELRGQGKANAGASLRAWIHLDLPAIARVIAAEQSEPIDLVAHGWGGTLALAAAGRELPVRRVVALSTPVEAEVPSALAGAFLAEGGHFSDFAASPGGAWDFELLFAMETKFPPQTLEALRALGTRDLSSGQAAEWLAWMRLGDLPLDDGTTVRSRLLDFDRPTLLFLALGDGFAGPELCAPLRDTSKAAVRLRTFSRFETGDDFSHVSLLLGAKAPSRVFPELEAFLRGEGKTP